MRHNYSDRITSYHTTLSTHQCLENNDETCVVDSGASHNILKYQQVKYAEINWIISSATRSSIAASLRFSGTLNGDLCKMGINLVLFQGLHFFAIAQALPFGLGDGKHVQVTANVKAQDDNYLSASCALGYRGNIGTEELMSNH